MPEDNSLPITESTSSDEPIPQAAPDLIQPTEIPIAPEIPVQETVETTPQMVEPAAATENLVVPQTPILNPEEQAKELVGATKGRNWLPIILIIVVFFLLGGGLVAGMTVFKDQIPFLAAKPTPTPISVPTVIPTPTPSPEIVIPKGKIEKVGDKMRYTNTEIGFLVDYPADWFALENFFKDIRIIYINSENLEEKDLGGLTHGLPGAFQIMREKNDQNFESAKKLILNPPTTLKQSYSGKDYATIEKIEINGRKGIKVIEFDEPDMTNPAGYVNTIYLLDDQQVIRMEYPNKNNKIYKPVYDQILSTFKFLEFTEQKVNCPESRPTVCTMECMVNPPYICGSDGKSYCTTCQACLDPKVEWYITQNSPCQ